MPDLPVFEPQYDHGLIIEGAGFLIARLTPRPKASASTEPAQG